jgi:pyridoxal phosphate enzyme (YggS family)
MNPERAAQLKSNFEIVRQEINDRAKLIAVSKTFSIEEIKYLASLGHKDFGENKVQELAPKAEALPHLNWHFIGHLQSNKVKILLALPGLKSIHSIDSFKLIEELYKNKRSFRGPNAMGVYLQVNTSNEPQKQGLTDFYDLSNCMRFMEENETPEFYLAGLMCMGPVGNINTPDFEFDTRHSFKMLKEYRDRLGRPDLKLSMGMSHDYPWALDEGSDILRVGSAIFGKRE